MWNFTHFLAGTIKSVKNSMECVVVIVCYGGDPYLIDNFKEIIKVWERFKG